MINIEDFDSNLLKIDKKSYKNIDIYQIGCITIKDFDYVKINSVNPLYLIIGKVDGYTEEKKWEQILNSSFYRQNKEVLKKYAELWDKIKNLIKEINGKPDDQDENYMKIKFNSDDNLPSNKTLKIHKMTIVIRSVSQEDNKYYPQVFLDECLYGLQLLEYDRFDLSEGIDVNKTNASKECNICHYWYFKDIDFKYEPYLWNGCHDLMRKAMNFNDIAIVSVKRSDYRIHFWYMSKNDAVNIMENSNLNEKNGLL